MAHKSIADTILMELTKQKEESVKTANDTCIKFMQENFDSYLSKNALVETDTQYRIDYFYITIPINFSDFVKALKSLGFIVTSAVNSETDIFWSVPKREKGKKMTPAQKMLYDYTIKYNKKMKELNRLAQTEINRVWNSIKERDFTSTNNDDGTFTVSLSLNENRAKKICDKKLLKFLSDRAFPNATINDNTLNIVLGKKEN
jgi:hypothetical protein